MVVACNPSSNSNDNSGTTEHDSNAGEEEHGDTEHEAGEHDDDNPERIPNNGAAIRIVSPGDGSLFNEGEEIIVEIETENFTLGEDDNHWEIYVGGESWASVEGGNTDEVLRGLEPGEHEISVFMSLGSHEQLEQGDSVVVSVME